MNPGRKRTAIVWSYRVRAICWAIVGALSFPLGWSSSVALVWCASVYANVLTDWSGGAAADDRQVIDRLDRIEGRLQPRPRRIGSTRLRHYPTHHRLPARLHRAQKGH